MRENLIELLKNIPYRPRSIDWGLIADHLIANDVIQVVRCKECENTCPGSNGLVCTIWGARTEPDAFCSHGERRIDV